MVTVELIYILRILVACICGMVIGYERKNRLKEAGIRTHCLVACGAALMMILSKYGFSDIPLDFNGIKGADPSRIASQVVSGVGFLGAGMIFVHKNTISGLTTAAGMWATAGIGMAIGAGMYITGIVVTGIVVVVQVVLHCNIKWIKVLRLKVVSIYDVDEIDYQKHITARFNENGISVHDIAIRKAGKDSARNYKITVEIPDSVNEEEILSLIDYNAKISAKL